MLLETYITQLPPLHSQSRREQVTANIGVHRGPKLIFRVGHYEPQKNCPHINNSM